MNAFKLKIASPDGNVYSGDAVRISLRGSLGDFAVMAGHAPFVTSVKPCTVKVDISESETLSGTTDGGLLTVKDNIVTFLSSSFKKD